MSLELTLKNAVEKIVNEFSQTEINPEPIQFQKTRKDFEGDITLVVFPFVKLAKKSPEQTAEDIGSKLLNHVVFLESYNVVKDF